MRFLVLNLLYGIMLNYYIIWLECLHILYKIEKNKLNISSGYPQWYWQWNQYFSIWIKINIDDPLRWEAYKAQHLIWFFYFEKVDVYLFHQRGSQSVMKFSNNSSRIKFFIYIKLEWRKYDKDNRFDPRFSPQTIQFSIWKI